MSQTPKSPWSTATAIASIDDLLELHDRDFVEAAYLIMLRRPVDPSGCAYFVRRLRLGYSRVALLDQMLKSPEANPQWEQVGRLRETLARYRAARRSLKGWWWLYNDPEVGKRRALMRIRALHNEVGRVGHEMRAAVAELRCEQKSMHELVLTLLQSMPERNAPQRSPGAAGSLPPLHDRTTYDVREIDLSRSGHNVLKALRF